MILLNQMKKSFYILILVVLAGVVGLTNPARAQEGQLGQCSLKKADGSIVPQGQMTYEECKGRAVPGESAPIWDPINAYELLVPLPCPTPGSPECDGKGQFTTFNPGDESGAFSKYLNLGIKIFIGISAVLAVVMIVIGGLEYMTSELVSSKEAGKSRMVHAILGLLIALGAFALLNTIDPSLLKGDVTIEKVGVEGGSLDLRGNCVVRNSGVTVNLQTTKENCEANPNSQSFQGTPTSSTIGRCIFRQASDLVRTESFTTKAGCELHKERMISWTPNP